MCKLPKVLILDDETEYLENIKILLRKEFNIITCSSSVQAKDIVQNESFDLLLVDIMMPEVDGYDFVKWMNENTINIPYFFVTAKVHEDEIVKGLKLGADDYIKKPFNTEELILRMQKKINNSVKNEKEIVEQKELINSIFKSVKHNLYIVNKDYNLLASNLASNLAKDLKCYNFLYNLQEPCHYYDRFCPLDFILKTKKKAYGEYSYFDKIENLTKVFEISAHPIFNNSEIVSIAINAIDISYLESVKNRLKNYKTNFKILLGLKNEQNYTEQKDKNSFHDEFDENELKYLKYELENYISNQILDPITSISLNIKAIESKLDKLTLNEILEKIKRIKQSNFKLIESIDILLDASMLETGHYTCKLKDIHFNSFFEIICEANRNLIETQKVRVFNNIKEEILIVNDEQHLMKIFRYLFLFFNEASSNDETSITLSYYNKKINLEIESDFFDQNIDKEKDLFFNNEDGIDLYIIMLLAKKHGGSFIINQEKKSSLNISLPTISKW